MIKNILVLTANGTEELELVAFTDILRRAGANVIIAGETDIITCARDLKILPDTPIHKLNDNKLYDLIYLPGGTKGVENILNIEKVETILKKHNEEGKFIAAICAAPTILDYYKILSKESTVTSHPSVKDVFEQYSYSEEKIVRANNILTSRGAGTALDFAFYIVELLFGAEESEKVKKSIVWNY